MTLALSLLNPWMLFGLILAAIPLIIHLFYRRRYQEVRWAAVMFLSGAVRRNAQKHRLQQLLLLTLRTLAIILLVLGFSRPLLDATIGSQSVEAPKHHVFAIDASLSMRCADGAGTRFENAVVAVRDIVNSGGPADSFQLLLMAGAETEALTQRPVADRDEILRLLDSTACSAAKGTPERALPFLREWAKSGSAEKSVYVLSDFQTTEWDDRETGLAEELEELRSIADVQLVDVASGFAPNVCVQSVEAERRFLTASQPHRFLVRLENFDTQPITDHTIRLLIDDQVVATSTVSIDGMARKTVRFEHQFAAPGRYRIVAQADGDRLNDDNTARCVVRLFDRVPVLLINGRPAARGLKNSTDFLQIALDPPVEFGGQSPYAVRVISEIELATVDLNNFAAVFVCNVSQFTADESARFREYVHGGGGLVVCMGDSSNLQNYNARLFGNEQIMPGVRLESVTGNAREPLQSFAFDTGRLQHPLMSLYRGNPGHGLENVLTFQYVRASISDDSSAEAALLFENGDPAILQSKVGSGCTYLVTIAGDDSQWSTWNTASGTFVSLMNEIAESAVLAGEDQGKATVGQPFSLPLAVPSGQDVSARLIGGEQINTRVTDTASGPVVLLDRLSEPGFVAVDSAAGETVVACNVDPAESDLRSISADGMTSSESLKFTTIEELRLRATPLSPTSANEASFALFLMALALFGGEQLLASRVGKVEWIVFGVLVALVALALIVPARQTLVVLLVPMIIIGGLWLRKWLLPRIRST